MIALDNSFAVVPAFEGITFSEQLSDRLTTLRKQSYIYNMNWTPDENGDEQLMVGSIELAPAERVAASSGGAAGDWLCAWCLNRVANEKDRFQYDGKDEFAFTNPAGIHFEIITFSQTLSCRQSGAPSLEHTWFPGHAWSFCQCDACGHHLGWYYTGPHNFVGLIKNRIVRGLFVRN